MSYKVDWSSDYWVPGNHIYEFYKSRKWAEQVKRDKEKAIKTEIEKIGRFSKSGVDWYEVLECWIDHTLLFGLSSKKEK